jgi:hypothetical protein
MSMIGRKQFQIERAERRAQRDEREMAAGKLSERVPDLTSLAIAIHETRPSGCVADTHYIRRVVLESAPALFELTCSERDCEDGGHDLTREVLSALVAGRVQFQGEQVCRGRCGPVDCGRALRYIATATYRVAGQERPRVARD